MRSLHIFIFLLSVATAFAQPPNDDCLDAISIPSTDNYCSDLSEFSNVGATPDPVTPEAVNQCVSVNFDNGAKSSTLHRQL